MYRYTESPKQLILENQVLLYSLLFEVPEPNKYYKSPFRIDKKPGCYFSLYRGKIYFVDWGDTPTHRDIFKFTSDFLQLNFKNTLVYLVELLETGEKPNVSLQKQFVEKKSKRKTTLKIKERYYNNKDVLFWGQFGLSLHDLKGDNFKVVPIKSYETEKRIVYTPMSYAFIFNSGTKIYSPYSETKWLSTVKKNDIGKINRKRDKLILTKSVKDASLLAKLNYSTILFQSESSTPDLEKIAENIRDFDKVGILFDNDKTGREYSTRLFYLLKRNFPSKEVTRFFTPKEKDITDFTKQFGINSSYQILKDVFI